MTDPDPFVAAERIIDPMVVKDAGFVHDAQFVAHALLGAQGWLDGPVLTLKHYAFDEGGYLATPASINEFVKDMHNEIEEGAKAWLARSLDFNRLTARAEKAEADLAESQFKLGYYMSDSELNAIQRDALAAALRQARPYVPEHHGPVIHAIDSALEIV